MSDTRSLGLELDRIAGLAREGRWEFHSRSENWLSLVTVDGPEVVSPAALEKLVRYASEQLGATIELGGGGYGCFDLEFSSDQESSEKIAKAVEKDARFQAILNELQLHYLRLKVDRRIEVYHAYVEDTFLVASNRKSPSTSTVSTFEEIFSDEWTDGIRYGLVTAHIRDFRKGQKAESFAGRFWKRAESGLGSMRDDQRLKVEFYKFKEIEAERLGDVVAQSGATSVLVSVPGYANSFASSLKGAVLTNYLSKVSSKLRPMVLIFSWASAGSTAEYLSDEKVAELSGRHLRDLLLACLARATVPVLLLAHSHGCKLAMTSLSSFPDDLKHRIAVFVAIHADVGIRLARQMVSDLERVCSKVVIYHSSHDSVLSLAATLQRDPKLGSLGIDVEVDESLRKWEVIDTTEVNSSMLAHDPQLNSQEVMADLYDALRGEEASRRFYVEEVDRSNSRWRLRTVLA